MRYIINGMHTHTSWSMNRPHTHTQYTHTHSTQHTAHSTQYTHTVHSTHTQHTHTHSTQYTQYTHSHQLCSGPGWVISLPYICQSSSLSPTSNKGTAMSSLVHNMTLELSSIKPGLQYDTGAYTVSVASSLVHNMTLELT